MRPASVVAAAGFVCVLTAAGLAQQDFALPPVVVVRPIEPPRTPLPPEGASAAVTRFSFVVYGDARGQMDGVAVHPNHAAVVNGIVGRVASLASTPFPAKFVLQTGDAVLNGTIGEAWNVSFSPLIDRIARDAGLPYFLAAGNHDVAYRGEASRSLGLHNMLAATARLLPPEGSLRRLNGYPTFAFGYGNLLAIAIDSNIASDPLQLAWVTSQLERLDRRRYRHIVVFFHHPPFSSGPHGGVSPSANTVSTDDNVERQTAAIRALYMPLFRRFHVRMTLTGHDHLLDHWVERYTDGGVEYRRDDIVTGGGGAPIYTYRGEPDVRVYLAAGAAQNVRLQHLMKPGNTPEENPNHFVVVRVDGEKLSVEVVGTGPTEYKPYGGKSQLDLD